MSIALWVIFEDVANDLVALLWAFKNMPNSLRHSLESFLESCWFILLFNSHSSNIGDLANENDSNPAVILSVAR